MSNLHLGVKPLPTMGLKVQKEKMRGIIYERVKRVLDCSTRRQTPEGMKIVQKDPWSVNWCFYLCRKGLKSDGWDTSKGGPRGKGIDDTMRGEMLSMVKDICEDDLGIKRHYIGIFADARAELIFRGNKHSVDFEGIRKFMFSGADILVIEKGSVAYQLAPFSKPLGIAILHSAGFVSEYGVELAEAAKEYGANIGIITDGDASGINIALKVKYGKRLGIDRNTITELKAMFPNELGNIRHEDYLILADNGDIRGVEESVEKNDHWLGLKKLVDGEEHFQTLEQEEFYINYLKTETAFGDTNLEYFKEHRIELDVLVKVVKPERFWK